MTPKSIFLALFLSATASLFSQPVLQWEKTHGGSLDDDAFCITPSFNNGYVIAGRSISPDGDITSPIGSDDNWLMKIGLTGTMMWQKSLGGTTDDIPYGIQQLSDGGYILAGKTMSNNGNVSGNHGIYDYWLARLDSAANVLWQKCYGGTGIDNAFDIRQTSDGGFIVCGNTQSNDGDVLLNHSTATADIWVLKLDSGGTIQWQKALGGTSIESSGKIIQTSDGGYALSGMSFSNDGDVSGNHGGMDAWVVKLDAQGNLSWQKTLGGSGNEQFLDITELPSGDLVMTGHTQSSNGDISVNHGGYDLWLVCLNSAGSLLWEKTIGGTDDDFGYRIVLQGNRIVLCGWTLSADGDVTLNHGNEDTWILYTNFSGSLIWQKTFGGSQDENPHQMLSLPGGKLIVTGFTRSSDGDVSFCHSSFKDYWTFELFNQETGIENQESATNSWNLFTAKESLVLNGLYPGKTYSLCIYDAAGRQLESQTVSGSQAAVLLRNSYRGICLATLNDGKQQKAFRFLKSW